MTRWYIMKLIGKALLIVAVQVFAQVACAQSAKEIVEHVKTLSTRYGTQIEFQDGIGLVKL